MPQFILYTCTLTDVHNFFVVDIWDYDRDTKVYIFFLEIFLLLKGRVIIGPSILKCTFLPYLQKYFYVIRPSFFCSHVRHNLYCTHVDSRMCTIFLLWTYEIMIVKGSIVILYIFFFFIDTLFLHNLQPFLFSDINHYFWDDLLWFNIVSLLLPFKYDRSLI